MEDRDLHCQIMSDLDTLKLSKNFIICSNLFLKKWKGQARFIEYFSNQWLESKNCWYEELEMHVPSTNNSLEATNRVIKDEDTLRERIVYFQL